MKAPYTAPFGGTKNLDVNVYVNGQLDPNETRWDTTLWVENNTDLYALMSIELRGKKVRVVTCDEWLATKFDGWVRVSDL